MQFCNGIFSVFVGKDLELLKIGLYDNKIDIRQNKQVFGFFEKMDYVDMIYLKFDFIKQLDNKIFNALYTIRVYYVEDKSEIPYDQYFPGLQGYLTPSLIDNHDDTISLNIEFAPMQFTKNDQHETFELKQIEYFVILQEKNVDDDLLLDYCSEPLNQNSIIRNQTDTDLSLSVQVPLSNLRSQQQRNFVFTILATVDIKLQKDDQVIQLDYYYEPNSIKWNLKQITIEENISFNYQWVGILIVIIIMIVALIVFINMRRRKIISKYENSQIINQQTEGIEMHYRGLNE